MGNGSAQDGEGKDGEESEDSEDDKNKERPRRRATVRLAPLDAPHIPAGCEVPDGCDLDVILIF